MLLDGRGQLLPVELGVRVDRNAQVDVVALLHVELVERVVDGRQVGALHRLQELVEEMQLTQLACQLDHALQRQGDEQEECSRRAKKVRRISLWVLDDRSTDTVRSGKYTVQIA